MSKSTAGDRKKQMKSKVEAFQAKCRSKGLKITPQRIAVYKALLETNEHPSAEIIFNKIRKNHPNISLDTVSRTLLTLSEIGSAFILEGSGDPKRFDANLEDHHHFRCVKCRKIFDVYYKPLDNIKVPPEISKKFKIIRKTVHFDGICDLCSPRDSSRRKKTGQ